MNEKPDVNITITATGATAELAHTFYKSMMDCGADKEEAIEGMKAFLYALFMSGSGGKSNQGESL